jgi:hypothetical protein
MNVVVVVVVGLIVFRVFALQQTPRVMCCDDIMWNFYVDVMCFVFFFAPYHRPGIWGIFIDKTIVFFLFVSVSCRPTGDTSTHVVSQTEPLLSVQSR